MLSENIYNIKDICININKRKKRNVFIPTNILTKFKLYSLYLDTVTEFILFFDKDTGYHIKNVILKHINKSILDMIT